MQPTGWPVYCLALLYENISIAIHVRYRRRWLILLSLDGGAPSFIEAMSQNLIWTLRDQHALQREFELLFARTPDPKGTAQRLSAHFRKEVQSYPVEWPSSSRPPSEHTWQFGRVSVRYRLIPDAQTVEVLSVRGPHIDADAHPTI